MSFVELTQRDAREARAATLPALAKESRAALGRMRPVGFAEGTRGTRLVVLVGQKRAVGMVVKGRVETRRWSKLGEWLA